MNINQVIGNYLKKEDFPQARTVTISHVTMTEMDGTEKPVLHIQETTKGLVLNKSNINLIVSLYGPETDNWAGKPLTLYNDPTVSYAGKQVGGIRVMINQPAPQGAPVPPAASAAPQEAPVPQAASAGSQGLVPRTKPVTMPAAEKPAEAASEAFEDDLPW